MANEQARTRRLTNGAVPLTERPVVLTADDDEFFRIALRTILTGQLGVREVIETGTFDEALEKLAERRDISFALFDLQMPGLDGPMGLRVVRYSFPDIRVAVVSSSQQRQDILTALSAGVHGYVPKSLGPADLARALEFVLQGTIFVPKSLADLPLEPEDSPGPAVTLAMDKDASPLTPRQFQVLRLLVEGRSNKEIARGLKLGEGTVKIHMAGLFRNLRVSNRSAAAVVGARLLMSMANRELPSK